jgi:hypothetical protein
MPTFVWFGSLGTVSLRSVLARVAALKLSGRVELRNGNDRVRIDFIAGVRTSGEGDEAAAEGWTDGAFRVTQLLPDFAGALSGEREVEGRLSDRSVSGIVTWADKHALTCAMDLYRGEERGHLSFAQGQIDEVLIDGKAIEDALPRIASWQEGTWRVALKPLFTEEQLPAFIPDTGTPTPTPVMVPGEDPPWLAEGARTAGRSGPVLGRTLPDFAEPAVVLPPVPIVQPPEPAATSSAVLPEAPKQVAYSGPTLRVSDAGSAGGPAVLRNPRVWVGVGVGVALCSIVGAVALRPSRGAQVEAGAAAEVAASTPAPPPPTSTTPPTAATPAVEAPVAAAPPQPAASHPAPAVHAAAAVTHTHAHGALAVESVPRGAPVSLDGHAVGHTPITLHAVGAGKHSLRVGDVKRDVQVPNGRKLTVRVKLKRRGHA